MKRLLLTGWLSLGLAHFVFGQPAPTFLWNGILTFNEVAPQVDATNFINEGQFDVLTGDPRLLYETSDTLNYTNVFGASMAAVPGFLFDNYSTFTGSGSMAANFNNAGVIDASINEPLLISFGDNDKIEVHSTNIVNPGTLEVDLQGLIQVVGGNVDLSRGTLTVEGVNDTTGFASPSGNSSGMFDLSWGVGLNTNLTGSFTLPNPASPIEPVGPYLPATDQVLAPMAKAFAYTNTFIITNFLTLTNVTIMDQTNITSIKTNSVNIAISTLTDVVFLSNTNPAFTGQVQFEIVTLGGGPLMAAIPLIHLQSTGTNIPANTTIVNNLYFSDTFETVSTNQVLTNNYPIGDISEYTNLSPSEVTYIPNNYALSRAPLGVGSAGNVAFAPTLLPNPSATNEYSLYKATFEPATTQISQYLANDDPSNAPGRIEISGSGTVNLIKTTITGANFLLLQATNGFIGANALLDVPAADINLTDTNGSLVVSNLLSPTLPRIIGELDAWSSLWTNYVVTNVAFTNEMIAKTTGSAVITTNITISTNTATITNVYHVLIVNSSGLKSFSPTLPNNVTLRSVNGAGNVLLSDVFNVNDNLLIEAQALTLTTNAPGSIYPSGEINLLTPDILWSAIAPQLQFLTNFGEITTTNEAFFAESGQPPFYNTTFTAPYQAFVNHGTVSCPGEFIWANYFENSGAAAKITASVAGLTVESSTNVSLNSAMSSFTDLTLESGNLTISNETLLVGGALTLAVTNALNPDVTVTNVGSTNIISGTTYPNTWETFNGFNLLVDPAIGSLLNTTVMDEAGVNQNVNNNWAAADKGAVFAGYTNNAAVGTLVLDGLSGSQFTFNAVANRDAIYIGKLELEDFTTNRTVVPGQPAQFTSVSVAPNMSIYYADAVAGATDVSTLLNGATGVAGTNGGRFFLVTATNTLDTDFNGPVLGAAAAGAGGTFSFNVNGPAGGGTYLVQVSTNLTTWVTIDTVTLSGSTNSFQFTDPNAGQFQSRFYRAVLQ